MTLHSWVLLYMLGQGQHFINTSPVTLTTILLLFPFTDEEIALEQWAPARCTQSGGLSPKSSLFAPSWRQQTGEMFSSNQLLCASASIKICEHGDVRAHGTAVVPNILLPLVPSLRTKHSSEWPWYSGHAARKPPLLLQLPGVTHHSSLHGERPLVSAGRFCQALQGTGNAQRRFTKVSPSDCLVNKSAPQMSPNVNTRAPKCFPCTWLLCLTYIATGNLTSVVAEMGKQASGDPRNYSWCSKRTGARSRSGEELHSKGKYLLSAPLAIQNSCPHGA